MISRGGSIEGVNSGRGSTFRFISTLLTRSCSYLHTQTRVPLPGPQSRPLKMRSQTDSHWSNKFENFMTEGILEYGRSP